jgi:hypothetical protein
MIAIKRSVVKVPQDVVNYAELRKFRRTSLFGPLRNLSLGARGQECPRHPDYLTTVASAAFRSSGLNPNGPGLLL